jgi:hypothetical protein
MSDPRTTKKTQFLYQKTVRKQLNPKWLSFNKTIVSESDIRIKSSRLTYAEYLTITSLFATHALTYITLRGCYLLYLGRIFDDHKLVRNTRTSIHNTYSEYMLSLVLIKNKLIKRKAIIHHVGYASWERCGKRDYRDHICYTCCQKDDDERLDIKPSAQCAKKNFAKSRPIEKVGMLWYVLCVAWREGIRDCVITRQNPWNADTQSATFARKPGCSLCKEEASSYCTLKDKVLVEDLFKKCKSTALRKSHKTWLKEAATRSSAKTATAGATWQVVEA